MKHSTQFALAALLSVPAFAFAADAHQHGHGHDHHAAKPAASANAPLASGEVKKIDKSGGKITIKHGPIQNLGMSEMTMIFRVKEPAMLDKVKAGDKIRFAADKGKGGALVVTRIETAS